jgi:hypothetical protein
MPQFQAISLPEASGLKDTAALHETLKRIVEDLEILMGQRGDGRAVTNDSVGVEAQQNMKLQQVRTPLGGTTSAAGGVPTYTEYINLVTDVQQLLTDVARIQYVLNTLILNMRL